MKTLHIIQYFLLPLVIALLSSARSDENHPCRRESTERAQSCCLLEIELRQIQGELLNTREHSGAGTQYLELQKEHDRLEAQLTLLRGLDSLAQDFRDFQQRLVTSDDLGQPITHMINSVREDSAMIGRLYAVHNALDELGANQALRTAQSTEELHEQLEQLCRGNNLASRADSLCRTLELRGSSLTSRVTRFPDAANFMGAFLEAYTISLSGNSDDNARAEQVVRYREIINQSANRAVVDQLVEIERNQGGHLSQGLELLNSRLSQIEGRSDSSDRLRRCLTQARYGIVEDPGSDCAVHLTHLERDLSERRSEFLATIEADQTFRQLVPRTFAESENLAQARRASRDGLEQIGLILRQGEDEEQRLSRAINSLEQRLRENLNTSLAQTPSEQLNQEVLSTSRSTANRTRNFQAMRSYANDLITRIGCDGQGAFLTNENENFSVDRAKLHHCLAQNNGTLNLDQEISRLSHQQLELQASMRRVTDTPHFRDLEAARNFLSLTLSNQCISRVRNETVRNCIDQDGNRMVVNRLLDQTGQILSIYSADGMTPGQQSMQQLNQVRDFCRQRREQFPNMCHQSTEQNQARKDIEFQTQVTRDFLRDHHVYHDPRTGENVVRRRQSTGAMFTGALAQVAIGNIGWGFQYWQTSQAIPFMHQAALNQKTMQFHQQQQMQFFQHNYMFNPVSFHGYHGLGNHLYGPRTNLTPPGGISL